VFTYRRSAPVVAIACAAVAIGTFVAHGEDRSSRGSFQFTPLPTSAVCTAGRPDDQQFILPPGYVQRVIAREGDGGSTDEWDQNTLNETGPQAGRYLYRAHEVARNAQVTVTDLRTGITRILAQRQDWNRLDPAFWTPWRTLLTAEELRRGRVPSDPDPMVPQALAGLVYELDPFTGASVARPALGAKAHEGVAMDSRRNVYGISETAPVPIPPAGPGGYIFKFVPDRPNDLSSGQLYALKIVGFTGDRTGEALWLPLDRQAVQVDADAAATNAGATGYTRPEDIAIDQAQRRRHRDDSQDDDDSDDTERDADNDNDDRDGHDGGRDSDVLYVAVTGENRVLRVDLRSGGGRSGSSTAFVSDYVRAGLNAPVDFENPDNLAVHDDGRLFITEDQDAPTGDDVWVASSDRQHFETAARTVRFASLFDCVAEPTGIYFNRDQTILFINVQHRGAPNTRDLAMIITEARRAR
jgi:secreted PhoX family phosphatase